MAIEVTSQKQLDAALKKDPNAEITLVKGNFKLILHGSSAPVLIMLAAATLHLVARETSAPSIVARETSAPSIEAWGTSAPRIVAWGTSAPSIEAWGYSMVRAHAAGSKPIVGTAQATVSLHYEGKVQIEGGHQVEVRKSTPAEWCAFYGVEVRDEVAIVYKAVDSDYSTANARPVGIHYTPGSMPSAPDWDGGARECGGGLHFSPHPLMAREFNGGSTAHYLACPVALADIAVHPRGSYPHKIKARGLAAPAYEVDQHGRPVIALPEEAA